MPTPSMKIFAIEAIIKEGKTEFFATAWIFSYWGIIGMIIPLLILSLRQSPWHDWANYPLFVFPAAGILSTLLVIIHSLKHKSTNRFTFILSFLWSTVSVNIFILAFGVPMVYGALLVPTIFLLISIAQITTGLILQVKVLSITGVMMNIVIWGYWVFMANSKSPNLLGSNTEMILLIFLAFIGQLVPGISIYNQNKKIKNK